MAKKFLMIFENFENTIEALDFIMDFIDDKTISITILDVIPEIIIPKYYSLSDATRNPNKLMDLKRRMFFVNEKALTLLLLKIKANEPGLFVTAKIVEGNRIKKLQRILEETHFDLLILKENQLKNDCDSDLNEFNKRVLNKVDCPVLLVK